MVSTISNRVLSEMLGVQAGHFKMPTPDGPDFSALPAKMSEGLTGVRTSLPMILTNDQIERS